MSPETLERLTRRVLLDALLSGEAAWWRRRAETFDAVGTRQAAEVAAACRAKATFIETYPDAGDWSELLDAELEDGAA